MPEAIKSHFNGDLTLKERAISLARSYKPAAILIEDTLLGTPLITELKQAGLPVVAVEAPRQDKVSRLVMHVAKFANGAVFSRTTSLGVRKWRANFFISQRVPLTTSLTA
jgi:phage terminase large subunit-like protein